MRSHSPSSFFSTSCLPQRMLADFVFCSLFRNKNARWRRSSGWNQRPLSLIQSSSSTGRRAFHLPARTRHIRASLRSSSGRLQSSWLHAANMSRKLAPCSSQSRCSVPARWLLGYTGKYGGPLTARALRGRGGRDIQRVQSGGRSCRGRPFFLSGAWPAPNAADRPRLKGTRVRVGLSPTWRAGLYRALERSEFAAIHASRSSMR